jgi:hypothetical protein
MRDTILKTFENQHETPHFFKNETEARIGFDQYKLLVDSLNSTNQLRDSSNNFWITVNSLAMTGISYIREVQTIQQDYKSLLLGTIVTLGVFVCLSWIHTLWRMKKSIDIRNKLLIKIEQNFPFPIFTKAFHLTNQKEDKSSIAFKQMLVPALFLIGYVGFGILLLFSKKV